MLSYPPPFIRSPLLAAFGLLFLLGTVRFLSFLSFERLATLSAAGVEALVFFHRRRVTWAEVKRIEVASSGVNLVLTEGDWLGRFIGRSAINIPLGKQTDTSVETGVAAIARFRPDLVREKNMGSGA